MSTEERTRLSELLTRKITILEKMYDSLDAISENSVQRFRLDSGAGTHSAWMLPLDQLVKQIDIVERQIKNLIAKLGLCSNVYAHVKRR